jgi:hypothetical protein
MSVINKTPFTDAVGPSTVPKTGTAKVDNDCPPAPGIPGRDKSGSAVPEVTYDLHIGKPKGYTELPKSDFTHFIR